MFDFLRNLTKSAEEKRQETITAYVDGLLDGRSRQQFEQEMAQDDGLRQEVAQLQLIKQSLRQLPQREVPRNFILDPAEFSRPPARQPWVQAYPVLRAATAMAAFFFIFALAAGAFTNFGMSAEPALAPAADMAQVEESAVDEAVESLAFEAEVVEEAEEMEMAEEDSAEAADEEMPAEAEMMEDEAMTEVTAEEFAEESADDTGDETAEETAATEVPAADALQGNAAEDGELPGSEATAVASASSTPAPTATVSTLPRVTPPTPLPDRVTEDSDVADNAVADAPESVVEDEAEAVESTAVPPEEDLQNVTDNTPANPLPWLQIGLGGLLLLLLGLTFYARRQR
ncbi:anti-sigma factor family protein [Candidatus Leptofilum sp.]|uniref:anti-sigma factor family protein n=1 Tax=Candidatus Leptofilum sp. TaxID=3241576 RepID=UPI003B596FB3